MTEQEFRQQLTIAIAQGICSNPAQTQFIALQTNPGDALANTVVVLVERIIQAGKELERMKEGSDRADG